MRYLMTVSYDGSAFYGYQKQIEKRTVQLELETVLTQLNHNQPVLVSASGRTDRGVHAIHQKIHFDLLEQIAEEDFKHALNRMLPKDIYVLSVRPVADSFHARFDVVKKQYQYRINLGEYNPFERMYCYQYNHELDLPKIEEAITYLLGEHDFTSFTTATENRESYVRTIYEIKLEKEGSLLSITFLGNGFLRYMVRNIVGTLIEVGAGKREPQELKTILMALDRTWAGKIAPPEGLYLQEVFYDEEE